MENILNFFRMVSNETRFRIIMLLHKEGLCVCQISGIMNLPQSKVSKHLAKLRDNGFIEDERKEKYVYYKLKIDNEVIGKIIMDLAENAEEDSIVADDLKKTETKEQYIIGCSQ